MVCGGQASNHDFLTSCLQYEPTTNPPTWTLHSNLRRARNWASAVTLAAGVYLLGGEWYGNEGLSTSEIIAAGSSVWKEGPFLPTGGLGLAGSCAVAINRTSFLLIGGRRTNGSIYHSTSSSVHEFSSLTGTWTQWPDLLTSRAFHACSSFEGIVVVAGGGDDDFIGGKTTEVVNLSNGEVQEAGLMATRRSAFGMFQIGYEGNRILVTFGSYGPFFISEAVEAESVLQEWRPATKEWIASPAVMATRAGFSAVSVEARHVCPQGQLLACFKA
jgi:hypothetical protein